VLGGLRAKIDDYGGPDYRRFVSPDDSTAGRGNKPLGQRGARTPLRRKARRLRDFDLRKTLFVLPNAITLAAVFCGFNAIRIVATAGSEGSSRDYNRAAVLLIFSMFFDLMDGRVARLTKTQSAFGLQLDSLADIVSFGVAPALLVHQWVLHRQPVLGLLASFSFVACAAIRLARFNVLSSADDGAPSIPGKYILGLPSPPASGILISLVVANHAMDGKIGDPRYTIAILIATVVIGLLMVSSVRFRSFKDLRFNTGTVAFVLFVLVSSGLVWRFLKPQFVLVWLLTIYVLIGVVETTAEALNKMTNRQRTA
jgi:CDP-diacylglycerol---serine O-phosphatidyltransferase